MTKTPFIACHAPIPNPKLRLFCFHHAGGGASTYRHWSSYMAEIDVEVVPIQLPGRENRIAEPCITDISLLLSEMMEGLGSFLDRPFALWGHSMGAMLAFEFAARLHQMRGPEPLCLFSSAGGAPQRQNDRMSITGLSDPAFIDYVKRFGGLPDAILADPEMMGLILPSLRADFELCHQHQFKEVPRLTCPIYSYGGIQDKTINHQALIAWESLTCNTFVLRRFPGDHFYIQSHLALLMSVLRRDLTLVFTEFTKNQSDRE